MMQTVGMQCELCGHSIRAAVDAIGCTGCEEAFHHACLSKKYLDADRCPRCEVPFAQQAAASERARRVKAEASLMLGERLLRISLLALFSTLIVMAIVHAFLGHPGVAGVGIAVAMVPGYAGWRVYTQGADIGESWRTVRLLSAIGAVLFTGFSALLAWSFYDENLVLCGLNVVATLVYGATAWALTSSSEIRSYVHERDRAAFDV